MADRTSIKYWDSRLKGAWSDIPNNLLINLLIFTINHVNFVLEIKASSLFLGLSLPMAIEPFTHVLLKSGTHCLQIYVFVAHWIFFKKTPQTHSFKIAYDSA